MAEQRPGSDILSCEGLTKEFRYGPKEKIRALDGVTLRAARGAVTGLIGPDGAGKTTLIRLATGLFAPEAGAIHVLGIDVPTDPQTVQSRVGYMPQRFGLYEDLTVEENLNLYAELHGITSATRAERYPQLMQMTGLGPFKRRLAGRLSGGMKQKLGLACTLVSTPELLLLDEPTAGMSVQETRQTMELIAKITREKGLTLLFTEHDMEVVFSISQRIMVLYQGRLIAEGIPGEIRNNPEVQKVYLGEGR